jgi:hypothetical protein
MSQKNFTLVQGTGFQLKIPLHRDEVNEPFGSNPLVTFTIDGVKTYTNAEGEGIEVTDELGNEAIVTCEAEDTAGIEPGTYLAQCFVQLEGEEEQCVWEGAITFRQKLASVAA